MKTQAWGWLAAAVLAAGLNSSYHNGGLQWAHEIASRVEHNSNAVLALATGRADQFLAEARLLNPDRAADAAGDIDASDNADKAAPMCPFEMARVQRSFGRSPLQFDQFQAMSDREQARLDRLEAQRTRIEHEVRARMSRVRMQTADFRSLNVEIPQVKCPRVRVNIPNIPNIRVPAPEVHVDFSGSGPV